MSTSVAKKPANKLATIDQMLTKNQEKLTQALEGSGITPQRFRTVLLNSLRKNEALQNCTIASLWEAMDAAAVAGIEIGGPTPLAYLVPYKTQCQLIISYRGLMELARRSGRVDNIACGVVHDGDTFIPPSDALAPQLVHQQSTDPKRMEKPITHVWCGYLMTNGSRVYDIMTADEVEHHKKRYAKGFTKDDSAWKKAWDTMALKTVLKRPINRGLVPIAQRAERLLELDNVVDGSAKPVASVQIAEPQQIQQQTASAIEHQSSEAAQDPPADLDRSSVEQEFNGLMSVASLDEWVSNHVTDLEYSDEDRAWLEERVASHRELIEEQSGK